MPLLQNAWPLFDTLTSRTLWQKAAVNYTLCGRDGTIKEGFVIITACDGRPNSDVLDSRIWLQTDSLQKC